jgi:hypothetical protein
LTLIEVATELVWLPRLAREIDGKNWIATVNVSANINKRFILSDLDCLGFNLEKY